MEYKKKSHKKIINIKEQIILQIVPREVHNWWLCHHLSVNEAAVASCSLATTYQRVNDLGFSYTLPGCGWVRVSVTVNTKTALIDVGWVG